MGSDNPPSLLLQEIGNLIKELVRPAHITILGSYDLTDAFKNIKVSLGKKESYLSFIPTKQTIEMDDSPLLAIRRKKDSSMCQGMKLVRDKKIDAFVSAGNTGALTSSAKMFVPTFSSIKRPALLAFVPTKKKHLAVLDIGANVPCRPQHLVQFTLLGIAFQKANNIDYPSVGLLNIGSEAKKGTPEQQRAFGEITKLSYKYPHLFNFKGNVEGKEVFEGELDVLITDGFTGNVFLKTAEGIASFIIDRVKEANLPEKDHVIQPLINDLQQYLHYAQYPGAILCGIDGIVIKCHGYSSPHAIMNGIKGAIKLVDTNFLSSIEKFFQTI